MKLFKKLSGIIFLLMAAIVLTTGCDGTSYTNTITINGSEYAVEEAIIYYCGDERSVQLHNTTASASVSLVFHNQSTEIPAGKWSVINNTDFVGIFASDASTAASFTSGDTEASVSLTIGGKDEGNITVDAAVSENEDSVEASYKGLYGYEERCM